MKIREATIQDARGIAIVHVDSWNTTYKGIVPDEFLKNRTYEGQEERWIRRLNNPQSSEFILVAENNNGEVVGFASASNKNQDSKFDSILSTIYILKKYQKQGIGKLLVSSVVSKLKELGAKCLIVWVFVENPSRSFYEKLGGELVGEKIVNRSKDLLEVAYGWDNLENIDI